MENVATFSTNSDIENCTELAMSILQDLKKNRTGSNKIDSVCSLEYRDIEKIFYEEITLDSELVDKLRLFDILSIDCFNNSSFCTSPIFAETRTI